MDGGSSRSRGTRGHDLRVHPRRRLDKRTSRHEVLPRAGREKGTAELQAIGAAAINQAVKAVAIARGYVAPSGLDLVCVPAFADVQIDGEDRTAIKLIVSPR